MNFLIIDATQSELMIVVGCGGKRYEYSGNINMRRHESVILCQTDELLKKAGIGITDIDVLGAVTGPGSFTGIRIGVTAVNALARATGAKLVAFSGLECALYGMDDAIALMDCKHGNYYALARVHGADEYLALNSGGLSDPRFSSLKKVYYTSPDPELAVKVLLQKVSEGDFKTLAAPFYIKKSSAENEK